MGENIKKSVRSHFTDAAARNHTPFLVLSYLPAHHIFILSFFLQTTDPWTNSGICRDESLSSTWLQRYGQSRNKFRNNQALGIELCLLLTHRRATHRIYLPTVFRNKEYFSVWSGATDRQGTLITTSPFPKTFSISDSPDWDIFEIERNTRFAYHEHLPPLGIRKKRKLEARD